MADNSSILSDFGINILEEILPFVVLANRSKSTFYKILYHETKF